MDAMTDLGPAGPTDPEPGIVRLHLLRHAKSDWDTGAADHDRPLSRRGRRAAKTLGRHLAGLVPPVDLVLCSTAQRARRTVERALRGWSPPPPVQLVAELYLASAQQLLDHLRGLQAPARCVLLCGHNPGLHELALRLVGDGDPQLVAALAEALPTGGLVTIDLPAPWGETAFETGRLVAFVTPRQLEAG